MFVLNVSKYLNTPVINSVEDNITEFGSTYVGKTKKKMS